MSPISASDSLALAKKHLRRVQDAWNPPDWLDLSASGLYALEAATVAAALHLGYSLERTHWRKSDIARDLTRDHGLPAVARLMHDLNEVRKSEAYGDIASPPHLDPEDVAQEVEAYIDAVHELLAR